MEEDVNIHFEKKDLQKPPIFDATIRWCLSFADMLSTITVCDKTPCTLRGMIEWHDLHEILKSEKENDLVFPVVTGLEEKLVLLEDGIPCTLQQLEEGSVKACLSLEFSIPHKSQKIFRSSNWNDIDKLPVISMVKKMQAKIASGAIVDTNIVSLACRNATPGYFRQRSMKYKAALALARGVRIDSIPEHVAQHFVARDIINKKEYLEFGTRTKLSLHSDGGKLVDHHISHLC